MQAGTTPIFNVFGMIGHSTNWESNPLNLLVSAGSPLSLPFRSAGATEDLFVTSYENYVFLLDFDEFE